MAFNFLRKEKSQEPEEAQEEAVEEEVVGENIGQIPAGKVKEKELTNIEGIYRIKFWGTVAWAPGIGNRESTGYPRVLMTEEEVADYHIDKAVSHLRVTEYETEDGHSYLCTPDVYKLLMEKYKPKEIVVPEADE